MGLKLPAAEHVVFTRSPLTQVICQIRVPAVLTIQDRPPAEFQELIRQEYPIPHREQGVAIEEPPDAERAKPVLLPPLWRFASSDSAWTVTLAPDFLALECTSGYQTFDHFLTRFTHVFEHYRSVYRPTSLDRVGLRYINELAAPEGESRAYWVERLNPLYTALLRCPDIEPGPVRSAHETRLSDQEGQFTVRHAYIDKGNGGATQFVLDYDRYVSGPIAPEGLESLLRSFNDYVFRVFLWSIESKLRKELGETARTEKSR
jgi:uncharacterized protein (TIGR04255 family)